MFFKKYNIHLLIILFLSVFIGMLQHYLTGNQVTLHAVSNHFFTLILAPVIFAAFISGVIWYLGGKINAKKIFISYLISWLAIVLYSTISIVRIYA